MAAAFGNPSPCSSCKEYSSETHLFQVLDCDHNVCGRCAELKLRQWVCIVPLYRFYLGRWGSTWVTGPTTWLFVLNMFHIHIDLSVLFFKCVVELSFLAGYAPSHRMKLWTFIENGRYICSCAYFLRLGYPSMTPALCKCYSDFNDARDSVLLDACAAENSSGAMKSVWLALPNFGS